MKILVTGGAGYIGSVTVKKLQNEGHEVVVYDNLVYGHLDAVSCRLVQGDLENKTLLSNSFKNDRFDSVIHFAAYALAGESMQNPYKYFYSNITGGLNLLEFMRENNIPNIIFSSTCAIYGHPNKLPVSETESKKPESTYGESKLMFENILKWYDLIHGLKYINLRYFNAAGAALDGSIGERHSPETHIIPIAINSAIKHSEFALFGNDYPTSDGTCIRDYIHVEDLATAHLIALEKLISSKTSDSFNLGTGNGYSNKQVVEMVKKVSGLDFPVIVKPRRVGDPPTIFADNIKATEQLGWKPAFSDLETIVSSAWKWHAKHV